ncbi:putative oxidoreductase [Flavihumibacter petaseus NBRC 106054]|uniref:Putative oxidoreductase n=2 Tax=Flavihumibacter TaxID=1004301 RepID=A0A0E9N452_9BACT|nr:putative oxidoreductase [Flavihumibacter petaseus NBRC 106054]
MFIVFRAFGMPPEHDSSYNIFFGMKNVAVIGLGKVGSLVGTLLSDLFTVTGFDRQQPADKLPFTVKTGSVQDESALRELLSAQDAVVSCLPYNLNLPVARIAHEVGIHYFDLTEDVPTTTAIRKMAETSKGVMAPQCGLAPGFIGIVGADLYNRFTKLRDVELRVGALPRFPNGLMGYSFTWSPAGVINEYINDAEVIHNGERKMVPSLEGIEMINIEGQEFEAFSTSGGLGTMCETLAGKVDTLNYKTMRYPGHARLMRFLLYELILKEKRELVEQILTEAKPPVREDVVYVYAVVEGWKNDQLSREEFYQAYHPIDINGKEWRAISWTTAASVAAVVEMVANGTLPSKGFIKQEEISFEAFMKTKNGGLYANHHV